MQEEIRSRRAKITRLIAELTERDDLVLSYVETCRRDRSIVRVYLRKLPLADGAGRTFEEAYDDVIASLAARI